MNTIQVLSIEEMKFLKRISIVSSNRYGTDLEIGFILYERAISKTYSFKEQDKSDPLRLIYNRKESDFPNDALDEVILQTVKVQYPKSFVSTTFVFTTSEVEDIARLTGFPSKEIELNIRPDFSGQPIHNLVGRSFNAFRKRIKLYITSSRELVENIGFFGDCDFNEHEEIFRALDQIRFL